MRARVLLIEDDASIASALQRALHGAGYEIQWDERGDTGLAQAQSTPFDVVLTDLKLPGVSGLELVQKLHRAKPTLPIILMTAYGTAETAIEAMKLGAYDYLVKPFEMPVLRELIDKAVANSRLISSPVGLGTADEAGEAIVGNSRAMQALYKEIGRIAAKPVNVLIRGETGTGKELIARAIFQHSGQVDAPFVAINCAAIPETLLESELFGHERGAFTGAESRRIGRFEQADHGTIFLDEIGDMSPSTQSKLLRVLQEKCLQRLGGSEVIPVDVRVIAATHCDLESAMEQQKFRQDLYYRLSVVVLSLPPLRERTEDIPDLVKYFLAKHGKELEVNQPSILPEALQWLREQPWPGNVRELENVVRKVLLAARGYPIGLDHVKVALSKPAPVAPASGQTLRDYVGFLLAAAQRGELTDAYSRFFETAERELIGQAIQLARGNQSKAALWLGVSRPTLREKLTQFGLSPTQKTDE